MHDGAVAGAAEVRRHLLGPLVRRVHRVRPANRVVVVRLRSTELGQMLDHELRCLQAGESGQRRHLVERALQRALRGGAVVTDDVVHECLIENVQFGQCIDDPADVVVGVLQETGVNLHLAGQHRLHLLGHLVPGRDALAACGEVRVGRDHAELLLPRERLLPQPVPALVEPAPVLVGPLGRHVVRRVRGSRSEVHEERLVRHQGLLLLDVADGLVGEVLGQVITLLGCFGRLDRDRALVQRRVVLVGLAADEAVEVLEAAAGARPVVERTHRARLPHRHLMALAELGGRVAIEPQCLRQCRARVGAQGGLTRRGGGHLGDATHVHGVVVATGQQRGPGRRAERGRVEAGVAQPTGGEPLRGRRLAGTSERTGRAEPDIVHEDH